MSSWPHPSTRRPWPRRRVPRAASGRCPSARGGSGPGGRDGGSLCRGGSRRGRRAGGGRRWAAKRTDRATSGAVRSRPSAGRRVPASVVRAGVFDVATAAPALAEMLARPTDCVAGAAWLRATIDQNRQPVASRCGTAPLEQPSDKRVPGATHAAPTRHCLLAVAAKKGGVGKSTVAANRAAARLDIDVRYVDLDPDPWSGEAWRGAVWVAGPARRADRGAQAALGRVVHDPLRAAPRPARAGSRPGGQPGGPA